MIRLLIIMSLTWLAGCSKEATTATGTAESHSVNLSGVYLDAYNLASTRYDFTGVNVETGPNEKCPVSACYALYHYDTETIEINNKAHLSYDVRKLACLMAHELAHHNGAGQAEAVAEEKQCRMVI